MKYIECVTQCLEYVIEPIILYITDNVLTAWIIINCAWQLIWINCCLYQSFTFVNDAVLLKIEIEIEMKTNCYYQLEPDLPFQSGLTVCVRVNVRYSPAIVSNVLDDYDQPLYVYRQRHQIVKGIRSSRSFIRSPTVEWWRTVNVAFKSM